MCEYPLKEIGLLVTPEIAAYIILASDQMEGTELPAEVQAAIDDGSIHQKIMDGDPMLEDYFDIALADDVLKDGPLRARSIDPTWCNEFTGEATTYRLPNDTQTKERTWYYSEENFVMIPVRRESTLFEPAYNHPDDLIKEIRQELKDILPKNFNIRPYIVKVDGTYFC